ncbi:hypothetical protein DFH28DRAFT_883626 [Melampsora americana]|nr:hypothetical protein DFH28DRAFT_883626 [Melampsora americana]
MFVDLPKCGWDGPVDLCATDTTPSDGHTEVPDKEQTFQVYFNLWQLQVPKAHPAKKGKQTAGGSRPSALKAARPKYVNYNAKLPTKLLIRPRHVAFVDFKKQVFASCNKQLDWISEGLGRALVAGGLTLQGYKNIHPKNKGKELIDIADGIKFTHFVTAALNAPASTVMGVCIVHENPMKTDNTRCALQSVHKDQPNGCDSGESDGEGLVSSEGVSALFTCGCENITSIPNPADPGLVLLLNTSRIRTWANDWANGVRGVDEVNPPMMRPKFKWIAICNY